ncbi:hypothetical protein IX39_19675 [Chryseobacterium formosense]|uniref:Uncharacterized protein n=1 Tax=Chryseobacterium formosense TaxID=236814 RepID=A0A085YZ90_9FLAO|nr:hypothetical protein [Chryseobacterium formosense]KFE97503.1 hypothetical protein IX39_19675 [Chryseobacterium formosense]SFT75546.1 hypothetical protein SAMN05421857_3057 [Chryseobacterium formosense]
MKKNFIFLGTLFFSGLSFAQVGVNTDSPQATLDIVGKPTDASSLDGVIAPRIVGAQLRAKTYTSSQEGALVYVTTADPTPAGQTVNVTNIGYYYFDGTLWQTVKSSASTNIYNANGSLTSNRTLMLNGRVLNFTGTQQRSSWGTNGVLYQENLLSSGSSAISLDGGSNSNLWIQQFYNAEGRVQAQGDATSLTLSTSGNTVSAPVIISTSAGGGDLGSEKMRVTGEGNVGIDIINPTEKLDNNGITRLRNLPLNGTTNAINTTSTGEMSSAQDQTFTATRTIVADANGVLGYVAGLPTTGGGTPPSGSINVGETISQVYSIPAVTTNTSSFNLGIYVTANSLPALPMIDGLQISLQGDSSNYYDPRIYNLSSASQLVSYQSFATQVNENKTSLNNTVAP